MAFWTLHSKFQSTWVTQSVWALLGYFSFAKEEERGQLCHQHRSPGPTWTEQVTPTTALSMSWSTAVQYAISQHVCRKESFIPKFPSLDSQRGNWVLSIDTAIPAIQVLLTSSWSIPERCVRKHLELSKSYTEQGSFIITWFRKKSPTTKIRFLLLNL